MFAGKTPTWQQSKWLTVVLVNGDGSRASQYYIQSLNEEDFLSIPHFINQNATKYIGGSYPALRIRVLSSLNEYPPDYPVEGSFFSRVAWSFKIRWWRMTLPNTMGMVIFLKLYDPQVTRLITHSMGVPELLFGTAKGFSSPLMTSANNVVITHELLHLLGASDKYDKKTGKPIFPIGYAEPERKPLYPQVYAEIMGGGIADDAQQSHMPVTLEQVVIGPVTAKEIGWIY